MRLLSLMIAVESRLHNLARFISIRNNWKKLNFRPENHYFELENDSIDKSSYKFAIFTDPQMGKEDNDSGGVGIVWDQDILHVEKMCNELSQVENLGWCLILEE